VPWSWKRRAIPLPTLWATTGPVPVTGTLYLFILFTMFSPTCFAQYSKHIEGDIIKRIKTYKCGCVTITP